MKKFISVFLVGLLLIGTDISIKEKTSLIDGLNRIERCNIEFIDNNFESNLYVESLFDYYKITVNLLDKNVYELSTSYFSYMQNQEKIITIYYIDGIKID